MKKGQNLSMVRLYNQQLALDLFISRPYCCEEMANVLGLTSPGVKKIIDEMHKVGVLVVDDSDYKKTVGRAPIYYKLNDSLGIIVLIDLTHNFWEISTISGGILHKRYIKITDESGMYTIRDFLAISENIQTVLQSDFKDRELLAIGISTYGKVDGNSGVFLKVGLIHDYKNINLKELYRQIFNVPILINNDIYFSAQAEMAYGALKNEHENSLFLGIGNGVASVLVVDGKTVDGIHGLSGEIGFNKIYSPLLKRSDILSHFLAVDHIVVNAGKLANKEYGDFDDFVREFEAGEATAELIVDDLVALLSNTLINYTNLLDHKVTVISGEINKLGRKFYDKIDKYVEENYYRKIEVVPSTIKSDIAIKGCHKTVIEHALLQKINENRE